MYIAVPNKFLRPTKESFKLSAIESAVLTHRINRQLSHSCPASNLYGNGLISDINLMIVGKSPSISEDLLNRIFFPFRC